MSELPNANKPFGAMIWRLSKYSPAKAVAITMIKAMNDLMPCFLNIGRNTIKLNK